jgi:hypothetical protein
MLDEKGEEEEEKSEEKIESYTAEDREKFLNMFSALPDVKLYTATYDYLMANVPRHYIRKNDLSVRYKTKKNKLITFSLLDYIFYLINVKKPPYSIVHFHKFISKTMLFPVFLMKNPYLRKYND